MTTIPKLKELLAKAVPFPDELRPKREEDGYFECPLCDGEASIPNELVSEMRSTNWAGGVQFYGVGHEHQDCEAFYRACLKHLPKLIAIAEAAQAMMQDHPPTSHHYHSHSVPGIWDGYKGAKSVTKCQECARVAALTDALAAMEK